MITEKERKDVQLSPTKKDYYQIWNELIEMASKISLRWTPDETNESDPGIVLLKALVAVADKLNYNIDKNTLEAFMPSATQTESMRKLTEMMGYTMHHYRAATCKVNISFKDTDDLTFDDIGGSIYFPKFVNLKNEDEDVNYVTLDDFVLQKAVPSRTVVAAEGELVECESNNDNIISMLQLDDNNRYLLPEVNVAENAIFVYNIADGKESDRWEQVDNLNTMLPGALAYKFGFDSAAGLPYLQFPDDIKQIIKDGLRIKYIRTSGVSGNIQAFSLNKLEVPALWGTAEGAVADVTADNFKVSNDASATNGADPESIDEAYNGFKKTIGTFDTLVTCRDYMNAIYNMTESITDNTPLVSNIIVSDIRDDINRAALLCSFNDYGICYTDYSIKDNNVDRISHFDLMLYPFKTIRGLNTDTEYVNSFKYDASNINKISYDLRNSKMVAHNFRTPADDDIICIKNYLRLKARIVTTRRVTKTEEEEILEQIRIAIYKNFNSRKLDFGEEIPYDAILDVIENADVRIKEVRLEDPALYTKFMFAKGDEVELLAFDNETPRSALSKADKKYNHLVLRNVLAGRIAAFEYNDAFKVGYDETTYPDGREFIYDPTNPDEEIVNPVLEIKPIYPDDDNYYIEKMQSKFYVDSNETSAKISAATNLNEKMLKLRANEVIQFRAPNFTTKETYPCYTNYFLHLDPTKFSNTKCAIPATFMTLRVFMEGASTETSSDSIRWIIFVNGTGKSKVYEIGTGESDPGISPDNFERNETYYGKLFKLTITQGSTTYDVSKEYEGEPKVAKYYKLVENSGVITKVLLSAEEIATLKYAVISAYNENIKSYFAYKITETTFNALNQYIKSIELNNEKLKGLYKAVGTDLTSTYGELINEDLVRFIDVKSFNTQSAASPLSLYYVQQTHESTSEKDLWTQDGLGRDAEYPEIGIDTEYELGEDEYLLINYTESTSGSDGSETKNPVSKYFGPGKIIKPNFKICDSTLYHNNHSYTKVDGFYFVDVPNCPGLFTLGANEQIAIREMVKVELDEEITYLYWHLSTDSKDADTSEIPWEEYYGPAPEEGETVENNAYTLKDGEYLYYTSGKKTDLVYYGTGTLIVRSANTPALVKYNINGYASNEEIVSNGLAADIPWGTSFDLSDTNNNVRHLTIIENQYISLTEGDGLIAISTSKSNPDSSFDLDLDNNWRYVGSAKYKFAGDSNSTDLPQMNVTGFDWNVRSRLDFNMSPSNPQVLQKNDSITLNLTEKLDEDEDREPRRYTVVLAPHYLDGDEEPIPLSVYSNYTCQCATDTIDTSGKNLEALGIKLDFRVKTTQISDPTYVVGNQKGSSVHLDNYTDGDSSFSQVTFEEITQGLDTESYSIAPTPIFTLKINLLDSMFGLIMFQYKDERFGMPTHKPARIRAIDSVDDQTASAVEGLSIFNGDSEEELTPQATRDLRPGVQVIRIEPGVKAIQIFADYEKAPEGSSEEVKNGNAFQSTMLFSDLSLVKGINPKLNYRYTQSIDGGPLKQLLDDIKKTGIARDFYYNLPVDKNNVIELNTSVSEDNLANPLAWYDVNNINNKFVISEIDADYLYTGLALTASSKV